MKEQKNQNHLENSKTTTNDWVFVAIRKELIAKRTETYVLVKLAYGYSVIINSKFLRKKESEGFVYASMPYDYKISARQTKYDTESKKWHITDERTLYPRQLSWELHVVEEQLKNGQNLEDILNYYNLNFDTDEMPK